MEQQSTSPPPIPEQPVSGGDSLKTAVKTVAVQLGRCACSAARGAMVVLGKGLQFGGNMLERAGSLLQTRGGKTK